MNKKLLALVMSAVLAFSVVACGEDDVTTPAPTPTPEVTQTAEPTPTPVVEDEEKDTTGEEVGGETEDKEEVETQQPETPEVKPVHNHSFTVVHAVVDATCTEGGTVTFKCEGCNATETRPSTPYGHDYKRVAATAATCTAEGSNTYECRRCGKTKVEDAKAIGHSYVEIAKTEPDCTTDGSKELKCNNCGDVKTEIIKSPGHKGVTSTQAPTCLQAGEEVVNCEVCGTELSKTTITQLKHTFGMCVNGCNEEYTVQAGTEVYKNIDDAIADSANLNGKLVCTKLNVTATDYTIGSRTDLAVSAINEFVLDGAEITTGVTSGDINSGFSTLSLNVPENTKITIKNSTINNKFSVNVPSVDYPYVKNNIADLVFENCTINGAWMGYPNAFKSVTFKNCTFTNTGMDLASMYTANCFPVWFVCNSKTTINFEECTFNTNRGIHIDGSGSSATLNVTGCTFNLAKSSAQNDEDKKVNSIKLLNNVTANVSGCKFNSGTNAFEVYNNTNVTINRSNNTFGAGVNEIWNR